MIENEIKKLNLRKEIYLKIKVVAKKPKSEIKEIMENGVIKIHLSKLPINNAANKELILLLSNVFNIPCNNIKIIKGKKSCYKTIRLKI
jgi:uncharacterized protein YggU (UPF0235/DUF167 family)